MAASSSRDLPAAGQGADQPVTNSKQHTVKKDDAAKAAPKKAAQAKFSYEEQSTYYFCAPAATRIALSARGHMLSQHDLADKLGTTENGTNSAHETTPMPGMVTAIAVKTDQRVDKGDALLSIEAHDLKPSPTKRSCTACATR